MNITRTIWWVIGVIVAILIVGTLSWFLFSRPSPTQTNNVGGVFGIPSDTETRGNDTTNPEPLNTSGQTNTSGQNSQSKIFQIYAGPVVGATLIQTLHPTTTLARYIRQEDGHVYDLPLDVPGAVPRTVSNVTIPGGARAIWVEEGNAAVMQYLDGSTVKTVYLGFPAATTTVSVLPTRIVFLPDAIVDIAASPDGKSLAYMLKTSAGVDGYTAKSDGTGSKKIFSLPLSQVLLSWPSTNILMVQSKSAAGIPGIIFSIDAKSGVATPLVYGQGLSGTINPASSVMLYQTSDGTGYISYLRDLKGGSNVGLPINPSPEQCIWSFTSSNIAYCASPIQSVQGNYFDLWHLGVSSATDAIFSLDVLRAAENSVATPGSADGGVASDILEMALSPNGKYLSFTNKGSRSVWGVRLSQ